MTVATRTTTVVPTTSFLPGQVTFFISTLVSRKKSRVVNHHSFGLAAIELSFLSDSIFFQQTVVRRTFRSRSLTTLSLSFLAGQEGLEPPTCGFGDRCSAN